MTSTNESSKLGGPRLIVVSCASLLATLALLGPARPARAQGEPVVTSLTLFAGTDEGPWRSRNWGGDWVPIERIESKGDDPLDVGAALSFLPLGPRVYLGGERGLLVSEDFGESWLRLPVRTAVRVVLPSRYPQADPTVFLGTSGGLLKSQDHGRSFSPTTVIGTPVTRIEWPGPALVLATGQGVMISTDAAESFRSPGTGLPEREVLALAVSSFFAVDPVLFAGVGSEGVFHSSDGGATWVPTALTETTVTDLVWLGPFLYAVTPDAVLRSQDLGREWTEVGEGLDEARPFRILFPLAPDSGAVAFLATDRGLYRTDDGGAHWNLTGFEDERVWTVATFPPLSRLDDPRQTR